MRTKASKAAKIRAAIEAGKTAKEIATELKVPVSKVYNERYKMKKAEIKERHVMREVEVAFNKAYKNHTKIDPALEFLREELASVERQIDSLNTVASFLAIRLQQMEQNNG